MNPLLKKIDEELAPLNDKIAEANRLCDPVGVLKLTRRRTNLNVLKELLTAYREKNIDNVELRVEAYVFSS